jgi:recombination protein RecT
MATQQVEARPTADQYKPIDKIETIEDALKNKGMIARFQQAVPRHLSSERMLRVCAMAVYKTPMLRKCETMSLLGAMLSLASLGLEPNTPLGHAYLIPFKSRRKIPGTRDWEDYYQVQVIIGYRGYIELARRSGMLTAIHADVVYEGDEFSFEYGSKMHLRHVPKGSREEPLWAYAHATLSDGQAFEVLPYDLVLKIRDGSQGYQAALNAKIEAGNDPTKKFMLKTWESNPWVAYEHEMAAKSLVRRLSKMLPMSIEFAQAVELDGMAEAGDIQYSTIINQPDTVEDFSTARASAQDVDETPSANTKTDPKAETKVETKPKPADAKPAAQQKVQERSEPEPAAEQQGQAETASDAPAAQDEQQSGEDATPADEAAAWEIVTFDGEVLPYDDPADFPKAYREERAAALKGGGKDGLGGFIESNAAQLAEFALKIDAAVGAALATENAALLKPPAQAQSGTLDLDAPLKG